MVRERDHPRSEVHDREGCRADSEPEQDGAEVVGLPQQVGRHQAAVPCPASGGYFPINGEEPTSLLGGDVNLPSRALYEGRDRAAARSFLYAIGLTAEDLNKPFVGVSNCWLETMPCNFGLRELAIPLKAGIKAAGANPMEFNTIAISDGITMGTEGMKAPLVSREIIADSTDLIG